LCLRRQSKIFKVNKKSGVTLIELLIVVLILAALSAIAIPRISQSATSAKARACATNIDLLNEAIERYYADNGSFPNNLKKVSSDKNYFPEGEPTCPLTGGTYPNLLSPNKRVRTVGHMH